MKMKLIFSQLATNNINRSSLNTVSVSLLSYFSFMVIPWIIVNAKLLFIFMYKNHDSKLQMFIECLFSFKNIYLIIIILLLSFTYQMPIMSIPFI